jgi:hypothetical protein
MAERPLGVGEAPGSSPGGSILKGAFSCQKAFWN